VIQQQQLDMKLNFFGGEMVKKREMQIHMCTEKEREKRAALE
jgi:hypothetical protein